MSRLLFVIALASALLGVSPIGIAQETGQDAASASDPLRYDAVGRLMRNHKGEDKYSPPYVLVDKQGAPRCYLTPDEGVSLSQFVNTRVGVRGAVQAVEGDSLPHIQVRSAQQVADPAAIAKATARAKAGTAKPSAPEKKMAQRSAPRREGVVPAAHVEPVAAKEELPRPRVQSRTVHPSQPEAIDGGTVYQEHSLDGDYVGPEPIPEGGPFGYGDDQCINGECGHACCPARPCGTCVICCRANDPGLWWVRGEYLLWSTKGMYIPPLATTGPDEENPGILGEPGTVILFGDETINNGLRSGGRISFGRWLDCDQTWGLAGEYFAIEDESTNFFAASDEDGVPTISRPYFTAFGFNGDGTVKEPGENAELVALEDVIAGSLSVQTNTSFQGAGAWLRYNICCKNMCWPHCCCDPCQVSCGVPGGVRVGLIGGYRFYKLRDSVNITEDLTSLLEDAPGDFFITDDFSSRNEFNGAEIGMVIDARRARWTAELIGRIAIGGNRQTVRINGQTTITGSDEDDGTYPGGLLALPTNIGTYNRSTFAVIPQLNANLGYNLTPHLRVLVGYTLIYWSSVARAGDQISLDVNETYLPRAFDEPEGPPRPAFAWRNTDFWAQGINIGLDYRF